MTRLHSWTSFVKLHTLAYRRYLLSELKNFISRSHVLDRGASGSRGSNDRLDVSPPPPPNPRNDRERKVPKAKEAGQVAKDLLKKGPEKFIEADGMQSMLLRGGMHLGLCRIEKF